MSALMIAVGLLVSVTVSVLVGKCISAGSGDEE